MEGDADCSALLDKVLLYPRVATAGRMSPKEIFYWKWKGGEAELGLEITLVTSGENFLAVSARSAIHE
jgi:hypothetical protein